jgi:hypothetical protein
MGLDMYLSVRKYVSQVKYIEGERIPVEDFSSLVNLSGVEGLTKYSDFVGISVSYPIGYWRKANAIHGWFVNTLADGVDECQEISVPREKLLELRDLCKSVLLEPAMAGDILPPTEGFFFGGNEINEWYLEDIKYTVKLLDHIVSVVPDNYDWSFIYQDSW